MLGLLFAGSESLVPAQMPLQTRQALGPLKARAVTDMSALRIAAAAAVSPQFRVQSTPIPRDSLSRRPPPQVPVAAGGFMLWKRANSGAKEDSPEVANFRASLSGMSDLADLSSMSLDQRESRNARQLGDWKEIIMADGRTYYRNVGDGVDRGVERWSMPDEFKAAAELEEASAL